MKRLGGWHDVEGLYSGLCVCILIYKRTAAAQYTCPFYRHVAYALQVYITFSVQRKAKSEFCYVL